MNLVSQKHYKDDAPLNTIHRIRGILKRMDILLTETEWHRRKGLLASVQLRHPNLPVFVNGKGIHEAYALASAYAEFMERLQNLTLLWKGCSGLRPVRSLRFSDSRPMPYEKMRLTHGDLLRDFFHEDDFSRLDAFFMDFSSMQTVPYYHLQSKDIRYLPYDFLIKCTGSNGMCAGNTPREALIQGLCEIFERFVLKELYFNPVLSLPEVPENYFRDLFLWPYFELMRENGYEVFVRDCTLGGRLPVAGVAIKKGDKASFNLGSAPDYTIAVERCFTELFQGYTVGAFASELKPIHTPWNRGRGHKNHFTHGHHVHHQFSLSFRRGEGVVPRQFFEKGGTFDPGHIFRSRSLVDEATLGGLIGSVRNLGFDMYVRDVSFLGFPAYHIYVPGMSTIKKITRKNEELELVDIPKARKTFFNLTDATHAELIHLAQTIERMLEDPYCERNTVLNRLYNLSFQRRVKLDALKPEVFICLLYCKAGEFQSAHGFYARYTRRYETRQGEKDPLQHGRRCLLEVLACLAEGASPAEAKKKLASRFEYLTLAGTCNLLSGVSRLASRFMIPGCTDCRDCRSRDICCFEEMDGLIKKVQGFMDGYGFDQRGIGRVLASAETRTSAP